MTKNSITSGQRKQLVRFAEDAIDRALPGLDNPSVQRLIGRGGEFQADIEAAIARLTTSDKFANEEVASSYAYPEAYKPRGIAEQADLLRKFFPSVGTGEQLTERTAAGMEGAFVIPRFQMVAPTYNEAVEKVIATIASTRKFYNYREGQLGPNQLRQSARTADMFRKLGNGQKGHDLLVVPAQFGLRHRGRSVRRARECFMGNEFGLGAFASGIMLLTHPERLARYEDLWIDCAGDEFAPGAGGAFSHAPVWGFDDDRLEFSAGGLDSADPSCGSASGFLPE